MNGGHEEPHNQAQIEPMRSDVQVNPVAPKAKQKLKRKPKRSIRLDRLNPPDFFKYQLAFFCDDCSHFNASSRLCTMGYPAQHTREAQLKIYELTGAMAMCRALEID